MTVCIMFMFDRNNGTYKHVLFYIVP